MTIEISPILRVRAISEATFGTDETGSLGSFTDLPFRTDSVAWTTDREALDPMTGKQRVDASDFFIPGWRRGTLSMTLNFAPTGLAAGEGVDPVPGGLGLLLKAVLGGENIATGGTVDATSTTAVIVDSGSGAAMLPGAMIGVHGGAATLPVECRQVKDIDSDLTLRTLVSGVPTTGTDIYAAVTYFLTQDPAESVQFVIEGAEADDGWVMAGCQLSGMTIDTTIGQIPSITLTWQCATYLRKDEAAGTIGGATAATITSYAPIYAEGDILVTRETDGTALPGDLCTSSITFTFALSYAEVPCSGGVSGIERFRRIRAIPVVSGSYTTMYEDDAAWDDWDNKEPRALQFQMGSTAGFIAVVQIPHTQITNVDRVDGGGIASQKVDWHGFEDEVNSGTSSTGDLPQSALRFHFL